MQAHAYGTAQHNPDAINLHAYPALTHAPAQWGEGIRFAQNGKPVVKLMDQPDFDEAVAFISGAAREMGVSFGDVCDALKFLADQKAI